MSRDNRHGWTTVGTQRGDVRKGMERARHKTYKKKNKIVKNGWEEGHNRERRGEDYLTFKRINLYCVNLAQRGRGERERGGRFIAAARDQQ